MAAPAYVCVGIFIVSTLSIEILEMTDLLLELDLLSEDTFTECASLLQLLCLVVEEALDA